MDAVALIQAAGFPVAFSHFHAVEIPNAIALKRFRKELTSAQENAALAAFESDVTSGRLARPAYDLGSVFVRAISLSRKYSAALGTRSMDILHVAVALEAGCRELVSFDERQRRLARRKNSVFYRQDPEPFENW